MRPVRKCCEATLVGADGVVFRLCFNRKTTPSSRSKDASQHFLDRSATPPCGDARRGIRLPQNIWPSFSQPRYPPLHFSERLIQIRDEILCRFDSHR
jgi:hypothetical protein